MTEFKVTLDLSERLEAAINRLCGVVETNLAPSVLGPISAPDPVVPTAPPPAYTLEQVSKAGADLIAANPSKMAELQTLLVRFGVTCVTALKPEQLGAFATALREMGANL